MTEEMRKIGAGDIYQSRISNLLSENVGLSIVELLVLAKVLGVLPYQLLKPELQSYLQQSELFVTRVFSNENESDEYLTTLENNGRILAFGQFPSFMFYSDKQPKRREQFNSTGFEDIEYYTVDAYINFIFSISSRFYLKERMDILSRYIEYFRPENGNKRRIVFFSRHSLPSLGRFSSMEFFPTKDLIIIEAPTIPSNDGDVFLEIRDAELCKQVKEFYTKEIKPLWNPMNLLISGKKTLQKMADGMSLENAVCFFFECCVLSMPDCEDPIVLLENFSPELHSLLKKQLHQN